MQAQVVVVPETQAAPAAVRVSSLVNEILVLVQAPSRDRSRLVERAQEARRVPL
jgi:hypothetical protein